MNTNFLFHKIYIFCFVLFLSFFKTQTVNTDYATQINTVFANLDKSKVPYSLLTDYAMEFEELSNFNGTITADNIVTKGSYIGIYNTLLMARVQSGVPGLVSPKTLTKKIWVGKPIFGVTQINDPNYYNESHFYLNSEDNTPLNGNEQGITQVKWTKLSSSTIGVHLFAANNQYYGLGNGPNNNWSMEVQVEVTNFCGTTTQIVTIFPPPALPCETYSLVRDDSDDKYVVVKIVDPPCSNNRTINSRQGEKYDIKVANSLGIIVISKLDDSFDLLGFPSGMYVVNISKDSNTIINQTLIKN